MPLTFGQARLMLAEFASKGGLCPDDPQVDLFVIEVLQKLLYKGPDSSLRSFSFQALAGCITIPYELEVPLKIKINNKVGSVWSQWFQYYDTGYADKTCLPASSAISEIGAQFPTVYDLPPGGSRVGVMGICQEAADAHVIVKGVDVTGREIFTVHNGEQVSGEYLTIRNSQITCTTAVFGKIESVVKTRTNGYVQLLAVNPGSPVRKFLADYSPFETIPQYRRYRLTVPCSDLAIVTVIGRIRLKAAYADSDPIPLDNINALKTCAQGIQLGLNNDVEKSIAKDKQASFSLTEEDKYKKVSPGQSLDVFHPTSGGAITNIVTGQSFRRWWGK